ncbi:MAG TPA: cytochrome-c oxidase, cbb3-type subunit III [Gammaproteobacteria bacterium]|nr:cytochrome-c oxidase, cbb3-type subunit III [Gammaproteobacteria bacterium]
MSEKTNPYKVPTTGHVWDDNLAELLNEPPKWWMIGFWASIIMVVIYFLVYPSIPLVNSHFKGIMGWTSIKELKEDMQTIEKARAKYENRLPGMSAAAILADDELTQYVTRSAKVLFGDNCAACHGTAGAGNPNFPVLVDDDWLYGGKIENIVQTIANGRRGNMPAHAGKLSDQEIADLAKHVKALSEGGEYAPGKEIFMGKGGCFACHGQDAKGMTALGSANLTDGIWRFSPGTEEAIAYTIAHGVNDPNDPQTRNAVMPKFGGKMSETDINKLAVYVYKLGGGQ